MFALRLSILVQKHRNPSSRSLGEKIVGDVVIGEDGVKSVIRPVVTGQNDRATDTGDAAYRSVHPFPLSSCHRVYVLL